MDDQQNQQQPPQGYDPQAPQQPAQPAQPVQPPVAPAVQPQPTPPQQPVYPDPSQQAQVPQSQVGYPPQQQPQGYAPQPQQPVSQTPYDPSGQMQAAQGQTITPQRGAFFTNILSIRRLLLAVGLLIVTIILYLVAGSLFSGNSYELVQTDGRNADFTIGMPLDWEVDSYFIGDASYVVARPVLEEGFTPSKVVAIKDVSVFSTDGLKTYVENQQSAILNENTLAPNQEINDVDLQSVGEADAPFYRDSYSVSSTDDTFETYKVVNHYQLLDGEGATLALSFYFTDEFSILENTVDEIISSYRTE